MTVVQRVWGQLGYLVKEEEKKLQCKSLLCSVFTRAMKMARGQLCVVNASSVEVRQWEHFDITQHLLTKARLIRYGLLTFKIPIRTIRLSFSLCKAACGPLTVNQRSYHKRLAAQPSTLQRL